MFYSFKYCMKESEFNRIIQEIRADRLPECPGDLRDAVLRRVRNERARNSSDASNASWTDLVRVAFRPQIATCLLALTVALGVMTTAVASQVASPGVETRNSLGFEVITNHNILERFHQGSLR